MIYTVKGFSAVNEAEIDVFLEFSSFFYYPMDVGNLISGTSVFMGNRWGNNGNSERLYFGGSKITADGDYSLEIKRGLLLGRKGMTNLESI